MNDQGVTDEYELERKVGRPDAAPPSPQYAPSPAQRRLLAEKPRGFYDLADARRDGGLSEPCGAGRLLRRNFPAGPQTLDLPGPGLRPTATRLENGDLDRTHRQQAFLVSVMRQLQEGGLFSNVSKLTSPMAVARKDIVLSNGSNHDVFRRLGASPGHHIEYRTLPVCATTPSTARTSTSSTP